MFFSLPKAKKNLNLQKLEALAAAQLINCVRENSRIDEVERLWKPSLHCHYTEVVQTKSPSASDSDKPPLGTQGHPRRGAAALGAVTKYQQENLSVGTSRLRQRDGIPWNCLAVTNKTECTEGSLEPSQVKNPLFSPRAIS